MPKKIDTAELKRRMASNLKRRQEEAEQRRQEREAQGSTLTLKDQLGQKARRGRRRTTDAGTGSTRG